MLKNPSSLEEQQVVGMSMKFLNIKEVETQTSWLQTTIHSTFPNSGKWKYPYTYIYLTESLWIYL